MVPEAEKRGPPRAQVATRGVLERNDGNGPLRIELWGRRRQGTGIGRERAGHSSAVHVVAQDIVLGRIGTNDLLVGQDDGCCQLLPGELAWGTFNIDPIKRWKFNGSISISMKVHHKARRMETHLGIAFSSLSPSEITPLTIRSSGMRVRFL